MLTDKEKLEEDLKLLEESLHLDVITKEEYEQAKQRTERKLKALQKKEGTEESEAEEAATEEAKSEAEGEKAEEKESRKEKIMIREIKVEKAKSAEEIAAEQVKKAAEEKAEEGLVEKKEEAAEPKEKAVEEIEKAEAEIQKEEPEAEEAPKPEEKIEKKEEPEITKSEEEFGFEISKRSVKVIIYVIAILVLAFGSYFFFFSGNQASDENADMTKSSVFIACSSDDDCKREGYISTCDSPGTEYAECAYIEDVKVKLFVLNDDSCFNCDTGRILSILNGFFPNLEIKNLDIETSEGKEVADKFDIDALPAYILNSSLQQANNYHKFFNAFNKVGNSFVVKNTVSNANYYIQREEIPGRLDIIAKENQAASSEAEKNLREFLDVFEGKVDFEKHGENSALVKELGINSFPAFLVNNKIKFNGVQAADVIKENFCRMNNLQECGLELSKSLI